MKPKVQIRHNFAKRLGRWLAGAMFAASMTTPALAVQINGPIRGPIQAVDPVDPVFLDPDVTITILDALDVLLNAQREVKIICVAKCLGDKTVTCDAAPRCAAQDSNGCQVLDRNNNVTSEMKCPATEDKSSGKKLGQVVPKGGE